MEKGFEYSFDDKSITDALNAYAQGFDFQKVNRNEKPIFENIGKDFYQKTKVPINKVDFGLMLVDEAIKNGTLPETQIYQHLKHIINDSEILDSQD